MEVPLQVSYQGVQKTDEIDTLIRNYAASLEEVCDYLISCRVTVEKPHAHQDTGNPFRVRILVRMPPAHELVVKRESTKGDLHADLSTVIANAFDAMTRQLREATERQRSEVKTHPEQQVQAFVYRIFKEQGYGFLKTPDEREIYFHRNSVLHEDFDRMEVGTGVRFREEQGEKGPQATSVAIVDKPGVRSARMRDAHLEPPMGWER